MYYVVSIAYKAGMAPDEQAPTATLRDQLEFVRQWFKHGLIALGGMFVDGRGAMAIASVEDTSPIIALIREVPILSSGIGDMDLLRPWQAQRAQQMGAAMYYVAIYEGQPSTPAEAEAATQAMRDHAAYVAPLFAAKQVLLDGPFSDGTGIMTVFDAGSMDEARKLATADPALTGGAFSLTRLRGWYVIYGHDTQLVQS
jgi:uncharacterized protein YciI